MKQKKIILDGKHLTVEQVVEVAREGVQVEIHPKAFATAEASRAVVLGLINSDKQIYGLNTGVGANKDNKILPEEYRAFNERIIHSHCVALPPFADKATVRATMLCRLNGFLNGVAGVQTEILTMLKDFLNYGIHPRIPERGSVGMADLGNMAYVGLAMIGEGNVEYNGSNIPAMEALKKYNLAPIVLGPKDALSIVSSNAYSVGKAALLCADIEDLMDMADIIYAMGYEAQGYNPMFIDKRSARNRPLKGQHDSLKKVRECLEDSHLWNCDNETLLGALSYKSSCAIHGAIRDSLYYIQSMLPLYINSSDDCPMVLIEEKEMISTDNFIVTGLAIAYEMMGIALAHLSKLICNRILRLDNDLFSNLPRFLRPDTNVISFSTIQKTISALDTEIRHLANPVSLDYLPTANETEDHGCNTSYVMSKTEKIVDLLYYLLGIELMHNAQAADLSGKLPTGKGTRYAYDVVRNVIMFLEDDDRDLGAEMEKVYKVVREKEIILPGDRRYTVC
ncbi:HAL/PAL/TAL family ammonia-lyase [Schnuerera ultunensis]|uniref:HAL/PAL/TAL family ammonia-lyase n=1 Tax=Schnuerera ultunensis TaxID=45497 RepID=UPI0003F6DA48|nr:aromatic amino acid ammonia-lyase [Schnuerera ultunensis]